MSPSSSSAKWLARAFVLGVLVVGAALRIWLASRGHNYDMGMWRGIADVAARGQNIYLSRDPVYDKPPGWFLILGGLDRVHGWLGAQRLGSESFHIVVASFLTLADIGVGLLLLRAYGWIAFLFFFLNPVSILLTGFQSQYDTLALLPALASWLLITGPDQDRPGQLLAAAGLMGLSLVIKHIMIFFPLWLLMDRRIIRSSRARIAFAVVAYAILVLSFLPFLFAPGAGGNIVRNVVGYSRMTPSALMPSLIDLLAPLRAVDSLFGLLPPGVSLVKYLFHALMLAAGWLLARRGWMRASELLAAYVCSMLIFTSVMNQNYLAIPLIACAANWRSAASWIYSALAAAVIELNAIEWGVLPGPPWWKQLLPGLSQRHAVVWLVVLLATMIWRSRVMPRAGGEGNEG